MPLATTTRSFSQEPRLTQAEWDRLLWPVRGQPVAVMGHSPLRPGVSTAFAFSTVAFPRVALEPHAVCAQVMRPGLIAGDATGSSAKAGLTTRPRTDGSKPWDFNAKAFSANSGPMGPTSSCTGQRSDVFQYAKA